MIRIGIDGRPLNTDHVRGMGKYAYELMAEASAMADVQFEVFADEPRRPLHLPPGLRLSTKVWEMSGDRFRAWEQVALPAEARRRHCDLLHCVATWCPVWQPVPTVVTIHDTIPWVEEPRSQFVEHVAPMAYARAAHVITISENSRRDIVERWPSLATKVTVIPHGIPQAYTSYEGTAVPTALAELGVRTPYILYMGAEIERKRLDWAVKVWQELAMPDLQFVACGLSEGGVAVWRSKLDSPWRERFICPGFVAEGDLPALYAQASLLIYSTLYEGFGFPALESQAVGTPVLMSDAGSLVELAGPGATLLPPFDLPSWVAAARRAMHEPQSIRNAARVWARTYSWTRTARATLDVYQRVLSRRGPRVAVVEEPDSLRATGTS